MTFPNDFIKRMQAMLGDEYDAFERALSSDEQNAAIRINILKPNAKESICKEFAIGDEVPWCSIGYYVNRDEVTGKHPYHSAGLYYFQEPSAMAPAEALPIEAGDRILDLCAAPGGKSTAVGIRLALADKAGGKQGILVSNEINNKRAQILSENIERMGLSNTIVTNESPDRLAGRFKHYFDKIIVDAPCSGEGMFRKEPQAITEWSIAHTEACALRQQNIIDSALEMLRPGGYLIYSTCTFAEVENEQIAEYILTKYPYMTICEMDKLSMLTPAYNSLCKGNVDVSKAKRILPHKNNGEGHFIALFVSTEEPTAREELKAKEVKPKKAMQNSSSPMALYKDFERKALNVTLEGKFVEFGETLYLLPFDVDLTKVKVLRAGLELGKCKKNRFEPSHALCLALNKDDFKQSVSLGASSPELAKYLHGETIPSNANGYICILADDYPIGWGKASGGVIKNHYPKHLRTL